MTGRQARRRVSSSKTQRLKWQYASSDLLALNLLPILQLGEIGWSFPKKIKLMRRNGSAKLVAEQRLEKSRIKYSPKVFRLLIMLAHFESKVILFIQLKSFKMKIIFKVIIILFVY